MNNKQNKTKELSTSEKFQNFLLSEKFPNSLINIFQYYLIIDKLFKINFFGELSWLEVFIPSIIQIFYILIFDDSVNKK